MNAVGQLSAFAPQSAVETKDNAASLATKLIDKLTDLVMPKPKI